MTLNGSGVDEADAMLIESVRQTNFLYNTQNADFRLSYKKEKAWEELAESLGIATNDAKRRWTCLRERYSRELRQLRTKSGRRDDCGRSEFFRLMDFLRPFVKKRHARQNPWERGNGRTKIARTSAGLKGRSYEDSTEEHYGSKFETVGTDDYNFVSCDLDPIESYDHYTTHDMDTSTTTNSKSEILPIMVSHLSPDIVSEEMSLPHHQVKVESKLLQSYPHQSETEDDFFCKSVAMYLRKLTRRHKIKAKVEIFQILEKYIEIEENTASGTTNQYKRRKP